MSIAQKYFSKLIGVYAPKTIKDVSERHNGKWTGGLCPRCTFEDGSFIETWGNEIIGVSGVDIDGEIMDDYDPAEAWFMGFENL